VTQFIPETKMTKIEAEAAMQRGELVFYTVDGNGVTWYQKASVPSTMNLVSDADVTMHGVPSAEGQR
jgi:hypothetical protein